MAISELQRPATIDFGPVRSREIPATQFTLTRVLKAFASLRLTVALFAMSIFLIYMGTLAQKDHDVWDVVNHTHFRTWFAWIDFLAFERLVQIFFKEAHLNWTGGFYFPGGNLLGSLLLVNLVAAHTMRFKVASSGSRLKLGVLTIAAGVLVTFLAIQSGMNKGVESELSRSFCDTLWQCVRGTLALLAIGGAYLVYFLRGRVRTLEWCWMLAIDALLAGLTIWLLSNPAVRLDDAGLRILWQLIKGSAAGIVLLIGCVMVFRKRAGIVLLHGGVGLLMLSELFTGISAKESQMQIPIGGTASYSSDGRSTELAVIDHSDPVNDHVTVVPSSLLTANVGVNSPIDDEQLPFKVQVHRWLQNSKVRALKPNESTPATAELGKMAIAEEMPAATGVGKRAKFADSPAAYVELISKNSDTSLGTYLVASGMPDQPVTVGGKTYDVSLRYKRVHYPFTLALKNFEFRRYVGTNTAKDFRSTIVLQDPRHNVDREVSIWMNNPLRYDKTTFYQSDFDHENEQYTVLTSVDNPSWMTPYVACMLVAAGMLTHFGIMLVRFLKRRAEDARVENSTVAVNPAATNGHARKEKNRRRRDVDLTAQSSAWTKSTLWFPALVVALAAVCVLYQARMPKSSPGEMQIEAFGELPLAYQGRIKPYDTLALNTLQIISERQQLVNVAKDGKKTTKRPIVWFLDVISGSDRANDHQVFRVENLDLLDTLGLERRSEHWRYSLHELFDTKPGELMRQVELASKVSEDERSPYQKKVMELYHNLELYSGIKFAFEHAPMPKDIKLLAELISGSDKDKKAQILANAKPPKFPKEIQQVLDSFSDGSADAKEKLIAKLKQSPQLTEQLREAIAIRQEYDARASAFHDALVRMLQSNESPCAVPPMTASIDWKPLLEAESIERAPGSTSQAVNPAAQSLRAMLDAYANGDVTEFNKQLSNYSRLLGSYERSISGKAGDLRAAKSEILSQPKIDFEVFYNKLSPFYFAAVLYLIAFLLGVFSWIGWSEPLRRASIWLICFTLVLHTFALGARIYISGRPPITNLYSTAIFIGWGGVILAMLFEMLSRLGLGNIVASVIGFLTLLVAHFLSLDGDTFIVLQAVLDTQFWLATHVVTINLGYAATYTAGLWGIIYVLFAHVFPILSEDTRHKLTRMIYGTLCFAIYFSFIGTVLGGLWGDDSWGRFWGWDPKENGALMIVLWNALVLHTRWGGMVKARGLATLVILGNIVTTWSYFGVNMLGEGLHSYGGTEHSTAMWLLSFAASQLALACLGMMPPRWFDSLRLSRPAA